MNIQTQIETELERAAQARARGKEGQARVCARRAAGLAGRDYFARHGRLVRTPSAYDLLNLLADEPDLPADFRQAASYLTLRVNEEFQLPVEVDLIAEAKKLCEGLLKS